MLGGGAVARAAPCAGPADANAAVRTIETATQQRAEHHSLTLALSPHAAEGAIGGAWTHQDHDRSRADAVGEAR